MVGRAAVERIIFIVLIYAADSALAEPLMWVEQSVRGLLSAQAMGEVQKVVVWSRRSRALEALCSTQVEGTLFPEACLKLVRLAGQTHVVTAAERGRIDRVMESRCQQGSFPTTRIPIGGTTRLSKGCLERIRSHNQDVDYTYSMHP